MCLGIPLQVHSVEAPGLALCTSGASSSLRRINTALLDSPPRAGDWLLAHVDIAIRALDPEEARLIGDALAAVTAAADGDPFEHLIADLVDREPELPEHLRTPEGALKHG
ncbi:MAG: HypC/HybG/HupF family hydrogenase formation chaperone [Halieaceae bacterium]|jgi:hydrogenase expression/formation protein HypC|nr:HypC/HybG/HupF family hydrogenase formation chaperone [Halieaceae bacterium]